MFRLCIVLTLCFLAITSSTHAQTVEDGLKARDAGDYNKAIKIFLPLAQSGNGKAMNAIGRMHSNGWGYANNQTLGCDWFEKSARANYAPAMHNLALCFKHGDGRKQNTDQALFWEEAAAQNGYIFSQIEMLRTFHITSPQKAKLYGEKAANAGNTFARVALWAYFSDEYERPSLSDIACVGFKLYLLGKPWDACN